MENEIKNSTAFVKGGEYTGVEIPEDGLLNWYKQLMALEDLGVKYPVRFEHTWIKFFTLKQNAVKFLKNNYTEGLDYQYFRGDEGSRKAGLQGVSNESFKRFGAQVPGNENSIQFDGVVIINELEKFTGNTHGVSDLHLMLTLDCYEDIALRQDRFIRDIYKKAFRMAMKYLATSNHSLKNENSNLSLEVTNLDAQIEAAIKDKGGFSLKTFTDTFDVGMGRNRFFEVLREDGYLCVSKSIWNQPKREMINAGILDSILDGNGRNVTFITIKGVDHFLKRYGKVA